jgi:hypothetical protein
VRKHGIVETASGRSAQHQKGSDGCETATNSGEPPEADTNGACQGRRKGGQAETQIGAIVSQCRLGPAECAVEALSLVAASTRETVADV